MRGLRTRISTNRHELELFVGRDKVYESVNTNRGARSARRVRTRISTNRHELFVGRGKVYESVNTNRGTRSARRARG